jgi:heme/copper-type cytochrome/quinol oxidase subunit 2
MRITAVLFMIIVIAVLFYLAVSHANKNKADNECQKKVNLSINALAFATLVTIFFQPLWVILNNL